MEILESYQDHPYFLGTQFHPEFRSRPDAGQSAVRRTARSGPRRLTPTLHDEEVSH